MSNITIQIFHTGEVCVSPDLPFGGENCSPVKASGIFQSPSKRLWLPVSAYLISHPKGQILVDTGWHREMSPDGVLDRRAQIKSLGSWPLYKVNQGRVGPGEAIDEQLAAMGLSNKDLDYVLITHLDCDHANGLRAVAGAKNILVSHDEVKFATKWNNRIRYYPKWWKGVPLTKFEWNGTDGPVHKSYDLFGDGSVELVNIPGHADGLFAVKVTNEEGNYVLLYSDGGYSSKSWKEMIQSGIAADRAAQRKSLEWIREQSLDPHCVESLANHDTEVKPHIINL
ncbi:MAG: N-acyl homoserine lactonase family protein [Clostridia bacterium]|nr:N-acyl homoserine lactonase family protein [Clostridia bacterium]